MPSCAHFYAKGMTSRRQALRRAQLSSAAVTPAQVGQWGSLHCTVQALVKLSESSRRAGRRKATGALKLVHDVYAKDLAGQKQYLREFEEAKRSNRELAGYLSKVSCTATRRTVV